MIREKIKFLSDAKDFDLLKDDDKKMNHDGHDSSENIIVKKSYDSYFEMIDSLCSHIKNQKLMQSSQHVNDILSQTSIKVNTLDLVKAIYEICNVAKMTDDSGLNGRLFIEDPSSKLMISQTGFIEKILSDIVSRSDNEDLKIKITIEIDDISKTASKIIAHLRNRSDVRIIKELPSQYLVTKNKKIIDLKNNEMLKIEDISSRYDVINYSNVEYLNYDDQSKIQRQLSILHKQIISRIMKDWSSNNEDVEYLLWQIAYSVLQNDNHGKFFILKGPGGNGKSTFMELLASLAGENNVIRANIHQFGDPNSINEISLSTKLIVGDDAATNHKISDTALSNLKSLSTYQTISLPVKYEKNRLIKTRAPFIQGTNTDISFFENNRALKGRAIVIDWTPTDFRSQKPTDITFNLDDLLDDQNFINEFFMMCLEKIEYFDSFKIPKEIEKSTNDMIESNDSIKLFLDDVASSIDGYKTVPIKALYSNFCDWSKLNNPSSGIMKLQTFTKSLKEKENEYQFKISNDRSTFKNIKHKKSLVEVLEFDESVLISKQQCIYFDQPITDEEIEEFKNSTHPVDSLDDRQIQIVNRLIFDYNQLYFKSIYEL